MVVVLITPDAAGSFTWDTKVLRKFWSEYHSKKKNLSRELNELITPWKHFTEKAYKMEKLIKNNIKQYVKFSTISVYHTLEPKEPNDFFKT